MDGQMRQLATGVEEDTMANGTIVMAVPTSLPLPNKVLPDQWENQST